MLPHYRRITFENISVELAAPNRSRPSGVGWFDCRTDSICENISFAWINVSNFHQHETAYFGYRCQNVRGEVRGPMLPPISDDCFTAGSRVFDAVVV